MLSNRRDFLFQLVRVHANNNDIIYKTGCLIWMYMGASAKQRNWAFCHP